MPQFELVSLEEAMVRSATGRRAEITKEYLAYIERLAVGQAGRLQPGEGETIATVRRRLGAAARAGNKNLVIKRLGTELYFWTQAPTTTGRRRGRPRKAGNPA